MRLTWGSVPSWAGLIVVSLLVPAARPAVFTVDFGSEWIKVVVVSPRLKPDPIAIAINEMSKRKSPALVALSGGERLVSEEAAGITARYPDRVYARARDLIGVPLEAAKKLLASTYAGFNVTGPPEAAEGESRLDKGVPEGLQKVWIRSHDGQVYYTAEELVAMILEYSQGLAHGHAKFDVVDAVVSVPAFFSQARRQALLDAASLVGVNVMALVHEHAGPALQYGMFHTKDLEAERDVLLYDMGATSTYAAVLHFSQFTVRERGRNVTNPQFQVKAVRWDANLGGQSLELRLIEHFADEFNAKMGGSFEVRALPKSMAKLRKAVKRTKEILSANTEAPISVESLFEENDFRSSITREKFEELCADVWPRAVQPLQQVLTDAGLTVQDLYAVEVVGGGTRVPKIQSVLQEFLGPNKTLDRHLDADESIALGSAWLAANLSDGFKLNRRVGMVDGMPFGVVYRVKGLSGAQEGAVEAVEESLFPRLKKFPLKVIRSVKQHPTDDFELSFFYDEAEALPPDWPASTPILTLHILGAKNATEKYSSYNLTHPLKTTLHFELTRSGTVNLEKAEVVVEFSEWTEVKVPIVSNKTKVDGNATDSAAGGAGNATAEEAASGAGQAGKGEGEAKEEGESAKEGSKEGAGEGAEGEASGASGASGDNSTDAAGEAAKEEVEEPKYEIKKKLRKRTIRVPLEILDATVGFQRLMTDAEMKAAQKRIEALRKKEAEKRATAAAKNDLEAYIYATKEKLDSDDGSLDKVSTEEQREGIRTALVDAEDWLYMDGEGAGPAEFKSKLREIQKEPEALFFRLKELSERPAAVRKAREFLEDTRETLSLWKEERPWINQTLHIDPLHEDLEELERWIKEKEKEQIKLTGHEEPAFTSRTVLNRVSTIRDRVTRVEKIPKPKPKKAPPPEADAKKNDTAGNKTDTEAPPGDEASDKKPPHDEL